jgi:hypothetical protein
LFTQLDDSKFGFTTTPSGKSGFGHSIFTSDSSSTMTPPPKSSNSDSNKYTGMASKISSNSYTLPSSSSSTSEKDFRIPKKPS